MAEKDDDWEDLVLDDLEEESELNFGESEAREEEDEERDEAFYASRLQLIEEVARRVRQA
jgi:hypothetical protein